MDQLIKDYMAFISDNKTERKCANAFVELAKAHGYKNLKDTSSLKAGDKVYHCQMDKTVILFQIGSDPIENGMNILGAHIDSPRLDAKQSPLYEKDGLVYLNTHYYGGVKKYQWLALPLALVGVVFKTDGSKVDVCIGEDEADPVFCISDILPHIAQEQMKKPAGEFIEGEKLDVVIGSYAEEKGGKDKVLELIKKKYQIEEEDFASAEIEVVPAGRARLLGLDESLILGYGQDDRVCAYTSMRAILEAAPGAKTTCCILTDKEEIGSAGATGMNSHLLDNTVAEVVARLYPSYNELIVRRALSNSQMLSSDVNAAFDPLNADLYDKQNSSFLGKGVVFNKYTGSRGKSGASDANPEFVAKIRRCLKDANVSFQNAELAKVDVGGGGTIAHYCAEYNMSVVDCGVSVLSMHAPWEITSVFDVQQAYLCYKAFLELN